MLSAASPIMPESQSLVPVSLFGILLKLHTPYFYTITHSGWFVHKYIFRYQLRKIFVGYHKDFVVFFSACLAIVPIKSSAKAFNFNNRDMHRLQ
jgi:hypothetical protein